MIPFLHTPPSLQILCHILINGIIIFTIPTPLILSSSHPLASHPLASHPLASHPLCLFHARIGVSFGRLLCLPASALAYVLWQKHTFAVGVRKSMSGGHHGFCRVASPYSPAIRIVFDLFCFVFISPPGEFLIFSYRKKKCPEEHFFTNR